MGSLQDSDTPKALGHKADNLNTQAVETAKAFRKLPRDAVLQFDRFTMQHSERYEHNQASPPCGCYWCKSQAKVIDLVKNSPEASND